MGSCRPRAGEAVTARPCPRPRSPARRRVCLTRAGEAWLQLGLAFRAQKSNMACKKHSQAPLREQAGASQEAGRYFESSDCTTALCFAEPGSHRARQHSNTEHSGAPPPAPTPQAGCFSKVKKHRKTVCAVQKTATDILGCQIGIIANREQPCLQLSPQKNQ